MMVSVSLPDSLTQANQAILLTYLQGDRLLNRAEWQLLYQTIDLLDQARVSTLEEQYTQPVSLRQGDQELIVVEYTVWKQMVLQVQQGAYDD